MSLRDKIRCAECGHPYFRHTGTHDKGSKTSCLKRTSGVCCPCRRFRDPMETTATPPTTSGNEKGNAMGKDSKSQAEQTTQLIDDLNDAMSSLASAAEGAGLPSGESTRSNNDDEGGAQ